MWVYILIMKVNVNIMPIIVNIVNIYYEVQGCGLIPGIGGENLRRTPNGFL